MFRKALVYILSAVVAAAVPGCGQSRAAAPSEDAYIKIGFATPGDHSYWDSTLVQSFEDTFTEADGYKLLVESGQAQAELQYAQISGFVDQGIDYIMVYPGFTNYDTASLVKARDAGIPLFFIGRMPEMSDESLSACFVTNDGVREGRQAVEWLDAYLKSVGRGDEQINIVHIQGQVGTIGQADRTKGITLGFTFERRNWNLLESRHTPGWAKQEAREVMDYFLSEYPDIDALFVESDYMAMGAVESIRAAGKKPGEDIIIVSIDGSRDALAAIAAGEINATVECSPYYGPKTAEVIQMMERGETPDKVVYVEDRVFDRTNAEAELQLRSHW
jgi:simple sugar transport system substrate-binding protein